MNLDIPSQVECRGQQFVDELLHHIGWQSGSAQPDTDLGGGQVLRLYSLQRLHVGRKSRVGFRRFSGDGELCSHIPGQIFVRRLPAGIRIAAGFRVFVKKAPL